MSRRLLALLAILSGLAALHAPAHASSRLDNLSYDIETLAEMATAQGGTACRCVRPPQKRKLKCEDRARKVTRPPLVGVLAPAVVVGADMSLE